MKTPSRIVRLFLFVLLLAVAPLCPAAAPPAEARRVVFLAGKLADEELVVVSAALAASGRQEVLLLDTPAARRGNAAFLAAWKPAEVVHVGSVADGDATRRERVTPSELCDRLFPRAAMVVVCPAQPRRLLLQAACLAGSARGPLVVLHGKADEKADLQRRLRGWKTAQVLAVGSAERLCRGLEGVKVTPLADEAAVREDHLGRLDGPARAVVVTNPTDEIASVLAPWITLRQGGALLLTDKNGKATPIVRTALRDDRLRRAEFLVLVGGPNALPTEQRPNPVEGKDKVIDMEPLTPTGREAFSFATGRLAHPDRGVLALTLARQRLLQTTGPRRALLVSNSGGGLPLLEVISRHTAQELTGAGFKTTLMAGKGVKPDAIRKALPLADLFLWEGHYKTLTEEFGFNEWTESLPPLLFLQTCLALNEKETAPLFTRGSVALIGSSSRVYSATGGAFALAYFDALLYDDQTLGGALRQAKNFLLAYSLLKQQRLGEETMSGVNVRSAWAFTLHGDPTLRLPRPAPSASKSAAVRHEVNGNEIKLHLPSQTRDEVTVGDYRAKLWPNGRLAGLVRSDGDHRRLLPMAFAEVRLPDAPAGKEPRLRTRLPEGRWVFLWDGRTRTGSLLVLPRGGEREVRFRVEWHEPDASR